MRHVVLGNFGMSVCNYSFTLLPLYNAHWFEQFTFELSRDHSAFFVVDKRYVAPDVDNFHVIEDMRRTKALGDDIQHCEY